MCVLIQQLQRLLQNEGLCFSNFSLFTEQFSKVMPDDLADGLNSLEQIYTDLSL